MLIKFLTNWRRQYLLKKISRKDQKVLHWERKILKSKKRDVVDLSLILDSFIY